MSPALVLALTLASICGLGPDVPVSETVTRPLRQARSLEKLYESGIPFAEFLEQTEERKEGWLGNYRRGVVSGELAAKARAIGGDWRLLVITEDWCVDSANTIPYMARLAEVMDGLDMRIVSSEVGRWVMETHPTPDGRGATPTVILLDENGKKVGCWTERPTVLQDWWLENPDRLNSRERLDRKYAWYAEDAGAETLKEIVGMLQAASDGSPQCPEY